jgi:hypothetical protein
VLNICVEFKSARPQERIIETVYARGGRGNAKLIGWSYERGYYKGDLETKEQVHEPLKQSDLPIIRPIHDYFNETTHPEIWNNIQWGRDQFKLSKRERNVLRLIFGIVSSGILGFIGWLIHFL